MEENEKKKNILIVDDANVNRAILNKYFYDTYNVLTAQNGEEALWKIKEYNYNIEVVLTDLVMPKMCGFELVKMLKTNPDTKEIPIIVITDVTNRDSCIEVYQYGAVDVICKPYEPEYLKSKVANIISDRKYYKDGFIKDFYQHRFESILNNIPCGIVVFQFNDMTKKMSKCLFLNKEIIRIFNCDRDHVINIFSYNNFFNCMEEKNIDKTLDVKNYLDESIKIRVLCHSQSDNKNIKYFSVITG